MNAKQRRQNDRHARLAEAKQTIIELERDAACKHDIAVKCQEAGSRLEQAYAKLVKEFGAVQVLEDVVREALGEARAENVQLRSEMQQLTNTVTDLQTKLADVTTRANENEAAAKETAKLRRRLAAREQQGERAEANRKAVAAAPFLSMEEQL